MIDLERERERVQFVIFIKRKRILIFYSARKAIFKKKNCEIFLIVFKIKSIPPPVYNNYKFVHQKCYYAIQTNLFLAFL